MFNYLLKYTLLVYFIAISTSYILQAQYKKLYFRRFNQEQGLSQSSVYSITQDQNGFIWLATGKGLNRFDGYDFINFYHNPNNKNSLSHNRVLDVEVDKWNRLWLATNAGVNCYDQQSEKFYHFHSEKNNPNSISEEMVKDVLIDRRGYLWVATRSGLNVSKLPLDSIKDLSKGTQFTRFPLEKLSNPLITRLFEDHNGNIWAATINGLNKINEKTHTIRQYFPGKNKSESPENWISGFAQINDKDLWISTQGGLFLLKNEHFIAFKNHPFFKKNPEANYISSLRADKYGHLWIGSFRNGIILYIPEKNKFISYKHDESNLYSIARNHAYYLFISNDNNLFVSTFSKGFAIANIEPLKFNLYLCDKQKKESDYKIRSILYDDKNGFWLGMHESGLYHFIPETNTLSKYNLSKLNENGREPTVKCIYKYDNDKLLIGTLTKGVHLVDKKTQTLIKEIFYYENNTPKRIEFAFDFKEDKNGNIWIASWRMGLFKLNKKTGIIKHYQHENNNPYSLNNNNLTSIYIEQNGKIWLTTWGGGINILDTLTEQFAHYTGETNSEIKLLSDYCTSLYRDDKGFYWIGSTEGLFRLDEQNKKISTFKSNSIIDNEIIYSIESDQHGNLWISTGYGINRFSTINFSSINYETIDGLASNEYYIKSSCKLPNGSIAFGSRNGMVLFNPDSISPYVLNLKANITKLQIAYKDIHTSAYYNKEQILKKSILYTDTLELSYKNNILGFEFSACNYTKPSNISYAYILEGFNKEWNYVNARKRFAVYTNLEPGDYNFKVKATKLDGTWSDEIRELKIKIKSPFWKTKWFVVSVFVFTLFIVFLFFRIKHQYTLKQKKYLEKIVHERTKELEQKNSELTIQKEAIAQQKEELFSLSEKLQKLNTNLEEQVKIRTEKLNEALIKAEASEKLISSFLANFSHEIRTPMNAISGFTQLIVSPNLTEEMRKKYADIINNNIDTLLHLIENVMEVSKLHSGQYKAVLTEFYLAALCAELSQELKTSYQKNDVQFIIDIDDLHELKIYSDIRAFKHIIYNLLENAFKYTEKGHIKLSCEFISHKKYPTTVFSPDKNGKEGKLTITISDTGIGIKESDMKHIFNAFHKPDTGKNKLFRGTGLGLALVKELCLRIDAEIEIQSQENKGTTVKVIVPLGLRKEKTFT